MFPPHPFHVQKAAGVAEEAELQRIPRPRGEVGVVAEDHGQKGFLRVGAQELLDLHAVFREGARLVGGDDGDAPQGLHRRKTPHHRLAPGHPLHPQGQGQGEDGGKPLGDGRHRQGHGEEDHLGGNPLHQEPQKKEAQGKKQDQAGHPVPKGVEAALQGSLLLLHLGEEMGDPAHGALRPRAGHL